MDDRNNNTIKPLVPSFVTVPGIICALLAAAAVYLLLGMTDLPMYVRIVVAVSLAGVAEVSASNLSYAAALRGRRERLFLPEINDLPATVSADIGAKRRRGGAVVFDYNGRRAEAPAITMSDTGFSKGEVVRIVCADTDGILLVEKA